MYKLSAQEVKNRTKDVLAGYSCKELAAKWFVTESTVSKFKYYRDLAKKRPRKNK